MAHHRKAIKYHEKQLKIGLEIGNRAGEGAAYTMEISVMLTSQWVHMEKPLCIMKSICKWQKKLVIVLEKEQLTDVWVIYIHQSMGDYRKAIDCHEKRLKIAIGIGDQAGEGRAYGHTGEAYRSMSEYRKAIEYHERHLKIALEIGDRAGEGAA